MTLLEKIEAHKQAVLSSEVPKDLIICPHCQKSPPSFKSHDVRDRNFLVIIENFVHQVQSLLARWRCPICGHCFTYYPDFALPYKRYVKDSIVQLSQSYVEEDKTPYRQVVQHQGSPIGYKTDKGIDERQLEGSTVWRWLSWIGGTLKAPLTHALNLIRQRNPSCAIFRKIRPLAAQKYRSEPRRTLLDRCMRFFPAEDEYHALFGTSIFPRFATGFP